MQFLHSPAFSTTMSIAPPANSDARAAIGMAASEARSAVRGSAFPPAERISSRTGAMRSAERPWIKTVAPAPCEVKGSESPDASVRASH